MFGIGHEAAAIAGSVKACNAAEPPGATAQGLNGSTARVSARADTPGNWEPEMKERTVAVRAPVAWSGGQWPHAAGTLGEKRGRRQFAAPCATTSAAGEAAFAVECCAIAHQHG
ncbi:MAG: hypothetical protein K2Z80_02485 [Xanthobacteraceae bacterium]|nr:hypothetical protein [Xanthobacteraceae bacterium]